MKQLLTIFFCTTMLLLQYSRNAAYLQCKFINAVEARHCDCEKILDEKDHALKEHNSLPSSVIKMNMPDEVFLHAYYSSDIIITPIKQKPVPFTNHFAPQQYAQKLIQPPRS